MILPRVTARLMGEWRERLPTTPRPAAIRYLGIPGAVGGGTTSFLAFGERGAAPLFVVKIYRDPDAPQRAVNERDVLHLLARCGGALATSVPRPVLCESIAGRWVIVQSIVPGRPMAVSMGKAGRPDVETARRHMELVSDWLLRLRAATAPQDATGQTIRDGALKESMEAFAATFDLGSEEIGFVRRMAGQLGSHWTADPVQHGDFCRQNVLVVPDKLDRGVAVVDWSDCRRGGLPLYDLFFFLSTYWLQVRKDAGVGGLVAAFHDTFFEANPYASAVRELVRQHTIRAQVEWSMVKPLFCLFLVEQAMREYWNTERAARLGGLPRFTVFLAASSQSGYRDALKEQSWIRFFREFMKCEASFLC